LRGKLQNANLRGEILRIAKFIRRQIWTAARRKTFTARLLLSISARFYKLFENFF